MFSDAGATPIRFPSTANLLIDSSDRTSGTAANFSITKNQSILNGYFTRFAVAEVVLQWGIYNIQEGLNDDFTVIVGGVSKTVLLPQGFYTIASALDILVAKLNVTASPVVFSVSGNSGAKNLSADTPFSVDDTILAEQLGLVSLGASQVKPLNAPNLLLQNLKYIDFISNNLTYQQGLKDASTSKNSNDILYRWYFAYDNAPPLDYYGYPILMGYQNFVLRRYLSFPKQIKWDSMQPIGQLQFQVYDEEGQEFNFDVYGGSFEWSMTLLVSEL